jgi:hypothetical protein
MRRQPRKANPKLRVDSCVDSAYNEASRAEITMTKPISPSEIGAYKAKSFPAYVFEAFNELIASNFSSGSATVYQKDAIQRILAKANADDIDDDSDIMPATLSRSEVFSRGYLNVEEAYRELGWKVEYDKPGYNESYDAHFIFKAK